METSNTLLRRMQSDPKSDAWSRFVAIYSPLILYWLQRNSIPASDVSDLVQEVLLATANDVHRFQHNGRIGAFRKWLRLITINRCRRYWNSEKRKSIVGSEAIYELLDELESPQSQLSQIWNESHDQQLLKSLLKTVRSDFSERTMKLFEQSVLHGRSPKDLANEFEMSVGQVYKAKFRVMRRLQQEGNRLIDELTSESWRGIQ